MALKKKQIVSAQIMLPGGSGQCPHERSVITAETLKEFLPSSKVVAKVTESLRALGFEVSNMVGNSVSISGAASLFASVFQTRLVLLVDGSIQFQNADGTCGYELARNKIPSSLRDRLVSVTFTP